MAHQKNGSRGGGGETSERKPSTVEPMPRMPSGVGLCQIASLITLIWYRLCKNFGTARRPIPFQAKLQRTLVR